MAEAADPWLVRVRALALAPDASSSITGIGGSVDADNDYVPELDITYSFNKNWAAELILAPTRHDMRDNGSPLGNVDLGRVSLLSPILTLQYHLFPERSFRPYVGAGVNYTTFYDEAAAGGAVTAIDYEDNFGWALQVGFDAAIDEHWALNFDLKKVFLNTDVSLNGGAILADVDLDPWIFSVGIGYRFYANARGAARLLACAHRACAGEVMRDEGAHQVDRKPDVRRRIRERPHGNGGRAIESRLADPVREPDGVGADWPRRMHGV
jgi:outer membrane protein